MRWHAEAALSSGRWSAGARRRLDWAILVLTWLDPADRPATARSCIGCGTLIAKPGGRCPRYGGIPRGAQFEDVLKSALGGCDALLALIGPQWVSCTRSDGRRRLDVPEDWVRNEIATALLRHIVIVPVLLGEAKLPQETDLPDDLRALRKRNAAEITETRWSYDVGELVKDLLKLTPLKPVADDVASADVGIRVLKDLTATVPAVADAVSRSKEVIANTHRQVGKLELFKSIHEALHNIEFDCLGPMQAGGAGAAPARSPTRRAAPGTPRWSARGPRSSPACGYR